MTLSEEPTVVDIDELLHEQEAHHSSATPLQWGLVVVGGVVGVGGMLIALVAVAPAIIDLVAWINSIQHAVLR